MIVVEYYFPNASFFLFLFCTYQQIEKENKTLWLELNMTQSRYWSTYQLINPWVHWGRMQIIWIDNDPIVIYLSGNPRKYVASYFSSTWKKLWAFKFKLCQFPMQWASLWRHQGQTGTKNGSIKWLTVHPLCPGIENTDLWSFRFGGVIIMENKSAHMVLETSWPMWKKHFLGNKPKDTIINSYLKYAVILILWWIMDTMIPDLIGHKVAL